MKGSNFTTWRKATYSHANGSCVEVATNRYGIGVRDTAQRGAGPVLEFPVAAWRTFVGSAKPERTSHLS